MVPDDDDPPTSCDDIGPAHDHVIRDTVDPAIPYPAALASLCASDQVIPGADASTCHGDPVTSSADAPMTPGA